MFAIVNMSARSATEVVGRCRLSDEQAISIDSELAQVDLHPGFTNGLEGERTFNLRVFREVRSNPEIAAQVSTNTEYGRWQRSLIWAYLKTVGRPILYADELTYLRLTREQIKWSSLPYREMKRQARHFEAQVQAVPRIFVATRILMPGYASPVMRRDDTIARINGTRIFIALHRYAQRHGTYPASLSVLASGLKWTAPLDPFSGGPFKYKRTDKGFLLYSIGSNLKDDGGVEKTKEPGKTDDGDIVWRGV